MEPKIETLSETKLVGTCITMSFAENKTKQLWQSFMPRAHETPYWIGVEFYSVEVYPFQNFNKDFNPTNKFEKWAAVKVSDFNSMQVEWEKLIIPEGLYAVFIYKGMASEASSTYQYIFSEWLPNSDYTLDNRPHFALMGENYKNEDPNSEEELWIPIRKKN